MNDKEKLILEDKNYFMKVIPEMISFCKLKKSQSQILNIPQDIQMDL